MDEEAFLEWLENHDGSVSRPELREEWPGFYLDGYAENLTGITVSLNDDGETVIPKRDLRDAVVRGYPLD